MGYYYVHPLDSPDLLDQRAVHDFIVNDVGLMMITPTRIKDAVKAKQLEATKISGNNHYTRRNVLKWLESIGVAIDWRASEITSKRDSAAKELAEANAALDVIAG